jgi:hypothetical protein
MEGRPEDESETSGSEERRRLVMVGEEEQRGPGERGVTRQQGEDPAEHLGERDFPFHVLQQVSAGTPGGVFYRGEA